MGTWVQLVTHYQYDVNGEARHLSPGDWVEVGKQEALRLIHDKRAIVPNVKHLTGEVMHGSGMVVRVKSSERMAQVRTFIHPIGLKTVEQVSEFCQAFENTVHWDAEGLSGLQRNQVMSGLSLLDKWEVVCPLHSYDNLAVHIGSEAERKRTQGVIRDLRVPMYDTRLVFTRRCEGSERLLKEWNKHMESGGEVMHAFLRALYIVKPLILALPTTWTDPAYDKRVA